MIDASGVRRLDNDRARKLGVGKDARVNRLTGVAPVVAERPGTIENERDLACPAMRDMQDRRQRLARPCQTANREVVGELVADTRDDACSDGHPHERPRDRKRAAGFAERLDRQTDRSRSVGIPQSASRDQREMQFTVLEVAAGHRIVV